MSDSIVSVGGVEISSNDESAEEMIEALKKPDKDDKPKVIQDRGQAPSEEEPGELSKAASELGKAGGKASAEKRATEPPPEPSKGTPEHPKTEPEPDSKAKVLSYFQEHPDTFPADAAKALEMDEGEVETLAESLQKDGQLEAVEVEEKDEKPTRAQQRIEQLARERAEERRLREAAEKELQTLKGGAKPEIKAEPAIGDYDSLEDYFKDRDAWVLGQAEARTAEQKRHEAIQTQRDEYFGRLEKTMAEDPDFTAAVSTSPLWTVNPTSILPPDQVTSESDIVQCIVESEIPGTLWRHLADNPEELDKIRGLPNTWQVSRAMGRLEARLAKDEKPEPAPKPRSNTPPPLRPVAASSSPTEPDIYGEDVDLDTYMKRKKRA